MNTFKTFKIDIFLTNNKAREFILDSRIKSALLMSTDNVPWLFLSTSTEIELLQELNNSIDEDLIEKIMVYRICPKKDIAVATFTKKIEKFNLTLKKKLTMEPNFVKFVLSYN